VWRRRRCVGRTRNTCHKIIFPAAKRTVRAGARHVCRTGWPLPGPYSPAQARKSRLYDRRVTTSRQRCYIPAAAIPCDAVHFGGLDGAHREVRGVTCCGPPPPRCYTRTHARSRLRVYYYYYIVFSRSRLSRNARSSSTLSV